MSKTCKKIITLAFLSGIGYLGYRIFRMIKDAIELEKFLPKFFESHVGEKPEIHLTIMFGKTTLTAKFSKKTLEKNPDLEQSIRDYVNNYYSGLCLKNFKVVLLEKTEAEPAAPVEAEITEIISETVEQEPEVTSDMTKQEPVKKKKNPPGKVRKPRKKKTEK